MKNKHAARAPKGDENGSVSGWPMRQGECPVQSHRVMRHWLFPEPAEYSGFPPNQEDIDHCVCSDIINQLTSLLYDLIALRSAGMDDTSRARLDQCARRIDSLIDQLAIIHGEVVQRDEQEGGVRPRRSACDISTRNGEMTRRVD
jgi:hypothetical protein